MTNRLEQAQEGLERIARNKYLQELRNLARTEMVVDDLINEASPVEDERKVLRDYYRHQQEIYREDGR